ncbi:unnamed protein product [Ambrosiozyma monospora]|uniref:Unnamed protein product n=1 Tax=Ambrosiozyma monospora TaxID=43982 RepID=A0A9W6Z0I1_AMBMO|nr:unnamed protein product [Ambrosiozyma monospora]
MDENYVYNQEFSDSMSLLSFGEKKEKRPAAPINDVAFSNITLLEEMEQALKSLSVHLFTLYTKGEFHYFKKLVEVFYNLEETKISFKYNLQTKKEEVLAKRRAAMLLTMISKFVAVANFNVQKARSIDVAGYECILARDEDSGELFETVKDNWIDKMESPAKLAQSQLFFALAPNYPVAREDLPMYPAKSDQFVQSPPCHVLVDFKGVLGRSKLTPKGYAGMTAYMYLKNSKKRLTEAFAVDVNSDHDIIQDHLSAAMFKNIPTTEIESGRIFLVCLLTETVSVDNSMNVATTGIPSLDYIRKGVCAGAVDISRIFSRRKDHLKTGEAHEFVLKLYASCMSNDNDEMQIFPGMNPLLAMSMSMANNGWGELVDRIISGSNRGVAVNPRAEQMIISVKELSNGKFKKDNDGQGAIELIHTLDYNPIESDYCRVYLRCIRTLDLKIKGVTPEYVTVELRTSSKVLKFSKGTNEVPKNTWQFISTTTDESISELIQIVGLNSTPTNENDYLYFDVFVNGRFLGEGRYPLRMYNQIADTGLFCKKVKQIELFSQNSSVPVGLVEIDLEYVGRNYNVDNAIDMILNWRNVFEKNISNSDKNLSATLTKVKRATLSTVIKFFPELLAALLEIYSFASEKHQILSVYGSTIETKFQALVTGAFECIVHILDMTIARQDSYVFLFDNFLSKHLSAPKVGEFLLNDMSLAFKLMLLPLLILPIPSPLSCHVQRISWFLINCH